VMIKKLDQLREPEKLVPWACQIARNKALRIRERWRRDSGHVEGMSIVESAPERTKAGTMVQPIDQPLQNLVDELPPAAGTAIKMRFWERMPYREIAEVCRTTVNAARSSVSYGQRIIRKKLGIAGQNKGPKKSGDVPEATNFSGGLSSAGP